MQPVAPGLGHCRVSVLTADKTHCWPDWGEAAYTPDYNKFYYILEGEGALGVDGRLYHPEPGDLFLMPAGVPQSYRTVRDHTYVKYWCHFRAEVEGVRLFDLLRTPYLVHVSDRQGLSAAFRRLIEAMGTGGAAARLRTDAAMLEILAAYLELAGDAVTYADGVPADLLASLTAYIDAHLQENIRVADLAALVHFHPHYFTAFFKKYFGMPPLKYVAAARIERAKLLLHSSHAPIARIAEEAGYHDVCHFSKRFKEATGYSPTDYRRL